MYRDGRLMHTYSGGFADSSYVVGMLSIDEKDGLNSYHARRGINGPRSSGIRRVHFGIEGHPWLDMIEEMDLVPALSWGKTEIENS